MRHWDTSRPLLDGAAFDIVVIGGGVNGVAIARECARAGRRTLVVEQHDFGAGTTSRSTRIIHGGLRYLEQAEIGLVRESLRERGRLLRAHPHLVRPLEFLLALDQRGPRSALEIRFALWFYRRFAGGQVLDDARDVGRLERELDAGRRWSIFPYEDAQCEFPERIVAEWLTEARAAGAVVRNYTEVLEVKISGGRACGVVLRDLCGCHEARVAAAHVVNATGPWADRICRQSRIELPKPMLGGVRGSHVVLPRFAGAPDAAVYTEAMDGRPIFLVPWNGQLLLGTTEIPDNSDPASVQASEAEIEYLFDSFAHLFPRASVTLDDVRYSFAGVRPLPFSPALKPAAVTRRHILHDHTAEGAAGMISVLGGKLTTAASLARACARKLGIRVSEPEVVAATGLTNDSIEATLCGMSTTVAGVCGLDEPSARALVEWHGPQAMFLARFARRDPLLRATLCPHTAHIVTEAVVAIQRECAVTLADIMLRRVPVALGPCWSEDCARTAAHRIGAAVRWTESQIAAQLEAFEIERSQFLRAPQRVGTRTRRINSDVGKRAA